MKKLIVALTLALTLSGCALTLPTDAEIRSVNVGDHYSVMLEKMGGLPNRVRCTKTRHGEYCTVSYELLNYRHVFFKVNPDDLITSVYY
ncbi:MAG TPA: hypothetical protein EYN67_11165 [Flavobacteriales bacterium]|nr:hypothetical protein [Flavobacteriales bacterium]